MSFYVVKRGLGFLDDELFLAEEFAEGLDE